MKKAAFIIVLCLLCHFKVQAQTLTGSTSLKVNTVETYKLVPQCDCTYSWTITGPYSSNIVNGGTGNEISWSAAGSYLVRITATPIFDEFGTGPQTYDKQVFVCANPSSPTTSGGSTCGIGTIRLNASGSSGKYRWYTQSGSLVTTNAGAGIKVGTNGTYLELIDITSSRTYNVAAYDNCGESGRVEATATYNSIPNITVTPNQTICPGSSVTLYASGGSRYEWSNGSTASYITVSPNSNTTYSVTGFSSNDCSATKSVTVSLRGLPSVTISGSTTICPGTSTTLTASGASTYTWSPNAYINRTSGSQVIVTPPYPITYTVTGRDSYGCEKSTSKTIGFYPSPNLSLSASKTTICEGESVSLSVSGANTYEWSSNVGSENINKTSFSISPTSPVTTYTVNGTNSSGCISSKSITINMDPSPVIIIPGNQSICSGETVTLSVSGAESYSWSPSTGLNTSTGASVIASPLVTTTYTITGFSNNCDSDETITVSVTPKETAPVISNVTTCGEDAVLVVSGFAQDKKEPFRWFTTVDGEVPFAVNTTSVTLSSSSAVWVEAMGECPSDRIQATATIGSPPASPILEADESCGPGTITVNIISPNGNYFWYDSDDNLIQSTKDLFTLSGSGNSTLLIENLGITQSFYVKNEQDGCISQKSDFDAVIHPIPEVEAGVSKSFCEGGSSYNLMDGGQIPSTGGIWSGPGVTGNTFNPSGLSTGSYDLTYSYTGPGGCQNNDLRRITINEPPTGGVISILENNGDCNSREILLSLEGYSSDLIEWYKKGETDNEFVLAISRIADQPEIFSYIISEDTQFKAVVDGSPCGTAESDVVEITLPGAPEPPVLSSPTICGPGLLRFDILNYNSTFSYSWFYEGIPIGSITEENFSIYSIGSDFLEIEVSDPGNYDFSVSTTDLNCSITSTAYTGTVLDNSYEITSSDVEACVNSFILLSISSNENFNYQWKRDGADIAGATGSSFQAFESGNYTVELSTPNCSFETDPGVDITFYDLPPAPTNITEGHRFGPGLVNIIATGSTSFFNWYQNSNIVYEGSAYSVSVSDNEIYEVYALDPVTGCESENFLTARAYVYDIPEILISGSPAISPGDSVELGSANSSYDSYLWSRNGSTISSDLSVYAKGPGEFELIVTKNGATGNTSVQIDNLLEYQNKNFIISNTIRTESIKNLQDIEILSMTERNVDVGYFDGLGRDIQTVGVKQSPNYSDMVAQKYFDKSGRDSVSWLPYSETENTGLFKSDAISKALSFYNNSGTPIPSDPNPYSVSLYEASSLNRPTNQGAPGSVWQPDNGHTVRTIYGTNDKGQVKWWRLNEHGYPVNDLTIPTGSIVSENEEPSTSSGLIFDGSNDYIALDFALSNIQQIPAMTVEAWLRTTFSSSGNHDNWAIIDFDRSEYFNFFISGPGKVGFSTKASGIDDFYSNTIVNDGEWHHVVGVFDGINKYIYVDGNLDATKSNPHGGIALGSGLVRYGFIGEGSESTSFNGGRNNRYFDGEIAEIKYWSRDLDESEINTSGNKGPIDETGLLLHYDLTNVSGNQITNSGSATATGTLFNFDDPSIPTSQSTFTPTNELIFDGINDYVALEMSYSSLNEITELTVEAWVNTSVQGVGSNDNWAIVDFDRSEFYNVFIRGDNGKVGFATYGGQVHDFYSNQSVNDGAWHHIACVFDGTQKIIYVDGKLDASVNTPHANPGLGKDIVRYGFIGDGSEAGSFDAKRNNRYFEGRISDLRIWHKARDEQEIDQERTFILSGNEDGLAAYYTFKNGGGETLEDKTGNNHHGTLKNMNVEDSWSDQGPPLSGYYPKGSLYLTEVLDENNVQTQEFKDKQGNTILKRTDLAGEWVETYYVYNARNQLVMVIQPEGVHRYQLEFSYDPDRYLDNWAFQYKYDERGRVVEKKVPGKEREFMVYDNRDRIVLTQDANLRKNNEWLFSKYDPLNREIMTGKKVISGDRVQVQSQLDSYYLSNPDKYSEDQGSDIYGYTNHAFPLTNQSEVLTVTYYDNYDFLNSSTWSSRQSLFQFVPYSGFDQVNFSRVKGQVTGTLVRILPNGNMLHSVNYYDDKYRLIQQTTDNQFGIIDIQLTDYDFEGKVLKTIDIHNGPDGQIKLINQMDYDHTGRLISKEQWIEGEEDNKVVLFKNIYNELGELMTQDLHSNNQLDFLQSLDFRYNIRGWLESINDSELNDQDDWFGMELSYDHSINGSESQYNGNISAITWSKRGPGQVSQPRLYQYSYDDLNRLESANYSRYYNNDWNAEKSYFDVPTVSYDLNGNINSLNRKGYYDGVEEFDILSYQYNNGNRLTAVSDITGSLNGFDDGYGGDDYSYDENGNMVSDLNKGISSIDYNHLNLPDRVLFQNGNSIDFIYDAAGIKLGQVSTENSNTSSRQYSGRYIYVDNKIEEIQTEVGRMLPRRNEQGQIEGYEYQYHMKDHLGNVRLTFSEESYRSEELFIATMETENSENESMFSNVASTRHLFTTPNHTPDGNESSRLNATENRIVGPALSFPVLPRDTIHAEVYAYYEQGTGNNSSVIGNALLASTLAGTFGYTGGQETQFISDFFSDASSSLGAIGSGNSDVPRAYLNYILFDEEYQLADYGFLQISESAKNNSDLEYLSIQNIVPSQEGYIYIYVSNESNVDVNVWFDDLEITHINNSHIVQMDDYYPFGLGIDALSYHRGGVENRWLFNGKELQSEGGLGLYNYGARMYDVSIGRWSVVDPLGELMRRHSLYNYAFDNPIRFIDPDGNYPRTSIKSIAQQNFMERTGSMNNCPDCEDSRAASSNNLLPNNQYTKPSDLKNEGYNSVVSGFKEFYRTLIHPMYAEIKNDFTIKVNAAKNWNKASSDIKDGIQVIKKEDQPGNAPYGSGKIIDETRKVKDVPPNNLSRAKQLWNITFGLFIDLNRRNEATQDSVIIQLPSESTPGVRPVLYPSGGFGRRRGAPPTEQDSLIHEIIENE